MKRRKFLKTSVHIASSSAYFYGLQSLFDLCMQKTLAHAQQSVTNINYVLFQFPGAPPRWNLDQPLNPNNKDGEFVSGLFGTEIKKNGSKFEPFHVGNKMSFGGRDIYMPPIWSLKSAGTGISFKSLLDSTLMIRGVDMEINSHSVNRRRVTRPVSNRPSVHGLMADKSNRPLAATAALGSVSSKAFMSETGISAVSVSVSDPIPGLVDSFKTNIGSREYKDDVVAATKDYDVDQIMSQLDLYAKDNNLPSQGGELQQVAAYEMFQKNLVAFQAKWQTLYDKYLKIVNHELSAVFPGVTDVNAVSDGSKIFNANINAPIPSGTKLNDVLEKGNLNGIARAFAFAEFVLQEKLTSSICLDLPGRMLEGSLGISSLSTDQHGMGAVTSIYFTSLYYRSFLGCLTEFKKFLVATGEFDSTLIQIMNEFSRTPKKDGSGSDHGFNGASVSLISGMITTPALVGNIRKQANNSVTQSRYPGTWGEAAPFFSAENRPLLNDDVVQTVCEMLEVKKIAVKGESLVKKSGGKVQLVVPQEVKNV